MREKRNKASKLIITLLMTGLVTLALSGCGKSGKDDGEKKEFAYVPEYVKLDVECDYIDRLVVAGDDLFISGSSWDEETNEGTSYFYKYNIISGKIESLPTNLEEQTSIDQMAILPDGNLAMLIYGHSTEEDEQGEVISWNSSYKIRKVSATDGSIIEEKDLSAVIMQDKYIQGFSVDSQENYYFFDGDGSIIVVNKDIQKICNIATDGWINEMFVSKEGDVYITSYGNTGLELKKVDSTTKSLSEKVEGLTEGYGNRRFYTGTSKSLLAMNDGRVSFFDITTSYSEELFNWMDVDINSDDINYMGELSDGRIWAITNVWDADGKSSSELVFINKVKASEVVQKEEITYGTLWLDYSVKKNIIDFNKKSDKYRIVVKEYGMDDYQSSITQFNADIAAGKSADIIDLSNVNYSKYTSMGVLEDLYPFMEQSGLKKDAYLDNVLKAYEVDGKLYGITSQFYVVTTMAKTSKVGDINGWTLSEMLDFVETQNPENVFSYSDRNSIFYYCIYNSIDEFIDWESGTCYFDSEDFIRTLEFAAKFPKEYEYNQEEEGIAARLHSDKILLMQNSESSVQEHQMINGMFGEAVSYVGYPNKERKGNMLQPSGGSMGISTKSKNKEAAWAFISSMLTEEYQESLTSSRGGGYGFPVSKAALEKQFEKDTTPDYYEDENGEQVEQMKTSWGYDDFQMDIYAATQEEVDEVKALIASAVTISGSADEQLSGIITEEAEAFFNGQKSAADVAGIIQNRIQTYVNENK